MIVTICKSVPEIPETLLFRQRLILYLMCDSILGRLGFPTGIYFYSLEDGPGLISRGKIIFD
jgi:hypothetical protein